MDLEVGSICAGKVTGITKYGAFVTLAPGKSGLVHISEIASSYVSDVRDHLAEGQEVVVKIIGVDQSGRLNLSIKAAAQQNNDTRRSYAKPSDDSRRQQDRSPADDSRGQQIKQSAVASNVEPSFEDKLKRFMQDSDNKISGLKQYSDKKGARRRGR